MEDTTTHIHELALRASRRSAKVFAGDESCNQLYFEAFYLFCRQKLEHFQVQIQTHDLGELGQLIYTVHHHRNYNAVKKDVELMEKALTDLLEVGDVNQQTFALGALRRNTEAKIKLETYIEFFESKLTTVNQTYLN